MGSLADLTLGRPPFQGFKRLAFSEEHMGKISRIEDYLKSLEGERKKIEAFKRELPICMQLLSDEIEVSKKQLSNSNHEEDLACSKSKTPFLEEFIPLKTSTQGSTFETIVEDRDNLTPVHQNGRLQTTFWSQAEAYDHGQEMVLSMTDKPYKKRAILCFEEEQACSHGTAKPDLSSRLRPGGAFLPFPRDSRRPPSDEVAEMSSPSHGDHEEVSPSADHLGRSSPGNEGANLQQCKGAHNAAAVSANIGSQRKPRRCWSPELHRRFVNALQQLGGSEVATPKQIRELMQVDGLTNDEVKSHLQKYRLHTRRPNPGFQPAAAHTPQVVVLGGIWVPQDYAISQNPQSLYIDPAQAEQTLHQEQPFSEGHMYTQQNASIQSFYHDHHHGHDHELRQRNAATPSQGSSQGPLQYDVAAHSSDAGGKEEEGLLEDGNEGSSWRAGSYQEELRLNGHRHSDAHEWRYAPDSGEDDSEAEDGKLISAFYNITSPSFTGKRTSLYPLPNLFLSFTAGAHLLHRSHFYLLHSSYTQLLHLLKLPWGSSCLQDEGKKDASQDATGKVGKGFTEEATKEEILQKGNGIFAPLLQTSLEHTDGVCLARTQEQSPSTANRPMIGLQYSISPSPQKVGG